MMLQTTPTTEQVNESGSAAARILFVEDDQALREAIAEYLTLAGFAVTVVGSGIEFFHALKEHDDFSVAVIDLGLPDIDGIQLAEYIRRNSRMRCIVLTARDSVDARITGYNAGADLYLVKPVDCRELVSALRSIMRRGDDDQPEKNNLYIWRLDTRTATLVSPTMANIPLTSREMDFIRFIANSAEQPVRRDAILDALGYRCDEYSNRALESLIRRLRRKIESFSDSAPILTHHGVGYSFSALLNQN